MDQHGKSPLRRRAVFLDVDGTIMQDGTYIPPSTAAAIRAARERGHLVLLSTGRSVKELDDALLALGFDGAVTNGGGFGAVGDELVVSRLLTADEVAHIEDRFRAHGVHWYLQTYDRIFASPDLPALMSAYVERDRRLHAERVRSVGGDAAGDFFSVGMKHFDDPAEYDASQVAKAVILSDDEAAITAVLAELDGDFAVVSGTIPLPMSSSGEVAAAGVNKGVTILDLLARLGVDPADAIGIGDNWNDVEMFEVCGTSIAMGNAVPGVQALADEVTTAIDDDGIHNAFVRHGLI